MPPAIAKRYAAERDTRRPYRSQVMQDFRQNEGRGNLAMRKHGETGKSQAFGTSKAFASRRIDILPLRTCAGVKDRADDRKIEGGACLRVSIERTGGLPDGIVAVLDAHQEVTPTRMERDSERRIGLACRRYNKSCRGVEFPKLNTKMRQLSIEPKRKHAICAHAHRFGIQ